MPKKSLVKYVGEIRKSLLAEREAKRCPKAANGHPVQPKPGSKGPAQGQ